MTHHTMHQRTVFIVDDDPSVRDALSLLLSLRGYATAVFGCAEDFLDVLSPDWQGCVVADIRMPGMSGLEMQQALAEHPSRLPVIVITGHGDIAAARQAFKAAAIDFLEKPFDDDMLVAAIERALAGLEVVQPSGRVPLRHTTLSQREREVMELVVAGCDNRQVGERLGISPRTVEVHKSRLMAKLGARNLPDLLRIASTRRR
ncbi:MAG: response regulator [Pseudomonadota bacterium]